MGGAQLKKKSRCSSLLVSSVSVECVQMNGCVKEKTEGKKKFSLTIRPSLQILAEWFGRTIIRSCTKLSYEHAQSMIESPTRRIPERELPAISPEHTCDEVHRAVLNLHGIAKELRRQRFADGALRLDQVSGFLFSTPPTDLTSAKAQCVRELAWQPWGLSLCPFLSLCPQTVAFLATPQTPGAS